MCLDWLWKATLDLTQAIQADRPSKEIYSMSETPPNKGIHLMNIYIRLDSCQTKGNSHSWDADHSLCSVYVAEPHVDF